MYTMKRTRSIRRKMVEVNKEGTVDMEKPKVASSPIAVHIKKRKSG